MIYLKGFFSRLLQVILCHALVVDAEVQIWVKTPFYIILNRARPSWRSTISATLGWGAAHGYGWCIFLAGLVDDMLGQGHCAAAYKNEADATFSL